jgi:plasmid replication initiation protein
MCAKKKSNSKVRSRSNQGIQIIKQSNDLIEARYKFDIWETRIFTSVLSLIHREDEDFKVYRVYLHDVIQEFDINNHRAYEYLRIATKSLLEKVIHFNYEENGAERTTLYHLLSTADYMTAIIEEDKRHLHEYFDIKIDPDMKPFLLQLKKQFTTYEMQNIIHFRSSYTVRMYEHLKQYESIGKRKMDVSYIKQIFELEKEYPLFANFYQKIIAPAHRDINAHSDLMITEIEKVKKGKSIISLVFKFHKKDIKIEENTQEKVENLKETSFEYVPEVVLSSSIVNEAVPSIIPAPEPMKETSNYDALYAEFETDVVKGFGVTPFVLFNLIQTYDPELIRKQIRITKRKRGASPTSNIAGFFVNAVKTDYNDPVEAKEEKKRENQRQNEAKQRAEQQRKQFVEEYNELTSMITTSTNNTIRKLVANDPTLTPRAIEYAKTVIINNASLHHEIQQQGYDLDAVDLNTWRLEPLLRVHVLEAIKKLEPNAFTFLKLLHDRVAELEVEIESLA